jgi:ferredoxin--NADP+ reductase
MFEILKKQELSDLVTLFEIEAKDIAKKAKAGNFFTLRIHEQGERIPLTMPISTGKGRHYGLSEGSERRHIPGVF